MSVPLWPVLSTHGRALRKTSSQVRAYTCRPDGVGRGASGGQRKVFESLHVHRTNAQAWPTARVRHGPRWRSEVVARLGTCLGHEDAERMAGRVGKDVERLLGVVGPVEQHPRAQPFRAMSLALQLFR